MMAPNPFFLVAARQKWPMSITSTKIKEGLHSQLRVLDLARFSIHTRNRIHERFDYIKKKKK
jgi:hypothetical protein